MVDRDHIKVEFFEFSLPQVFIVVDTGGISNKMADKDGEADSSLSFKDEFLK